MLMITVEDASIVDHFETKLKHNYESLEIFIETELFVVIELFVDILK